MKKKKSRPSYYPTFKYPEAYPKESNPSPGAQNREDQDTILGLIASLHLNSDYSDVTIICKDKILFAHRLVICPRSKYFQNACYGGFKEAAQPIRLNEKDPILIQKMLEFLYTGDYTTPCSTQTSEIAQVEGRDVPEMDGQHVESRPENDVTNEVEVHLHEHFTESVTTDLDDTPDTLMHRPQTNDDPALIDESHQNYTTKEEDKSVVTEPLRDSLIDCHPCYFHIRVYGEADYFMIDDLKRKAEAHFCASFMSSPKAESFAETIEELYSTQGNYHELRQAAIEMIISNLPGLRSGPVPVITSDLLKLVPDFTYDLLQATLDKYVRDPAETEEGQSDLKFDPWGS